MADGSTHPCSNCFHALSRHKGAQCGVVYAGGRGRCNCPEWKPGPRAPDQAGAAFNQAWRPGQKMPGRREEVRDD